MKYRVIRKIMRMGKPNHYSLLVTIPRIWGESVGIDAGDRVVMEMTDKYLKIYPKD